MTNFEKAIAKIIKENDAAREEGISIGKRQGINIGKQQEISQVVKEMLKKKVREKDIIEYTKISKKELEEIKSQLICD